MLVRGDGTQIFLHPNDTDTTNPCYEGVLRQFTDCPYKYLFESKYSVGVQLTVAPNDRRVTFDTSADSNPLAKNKKTRRGIKNRRASHTSLERAVSPGVVELDL